MLIFRFHICMFCHTVHKSLYNTPEEREDPTKQNRVCLRMQCLQEKRFSCKQKHLYKPIFSCKRVQIYLLLFSCYEMHLTCESEGSLKPGFDRKNDIQKMLNAGPHFVQIDKCTCKCSSEMMCYF